MEFKKYHFSNSRPHDFLHWCEKNKLYKSSSKDTSRMQLIYNGLEPFVGLDAIVASVGNTPIGIITCEHRELKKEKSMRENPHLEFLNMGFINIYVKPKFRGQGIATHLLKDMELLRLGILEGNLNNNTITYFVAREKAKILVEQKSLYTYAVGFDIEHRGREMEIDNIAYHKTCKLSNNNYQPPKYDKYIGFQLKNDRENIPQSDYLEKFEIPIKKKIIKP